MKLTMALIVALLAFFGIGPIIGSADLYAFPNEHIVLHANSGTTATTGIQYLWTLPSGTFSENGGTVITSNQDLILDLPDVAGATDYTFKVLVKDTTGGEACGNEATFVVHVVRCCPIGGTFCTSTSHTFCWYDTCKVNNLPPTAWPTGWAAAPPTVTFHWDVNGVPDAYTGSCITPDFTATAKGWIQPSPATPSQVNTMVMRAVQTQPTGHTANIPLYSCTGIGVTLIYKPIPSITGSP
jgi:hypothetical protein